MVKSFIPAVVAAGIFAAAAGPAFAAPSHPVAKSQDVIVVVDGWRDTVAHRTVHRGQHIWLAMHEGSRYDNFDVAAAPSEVLRQVDDTKRLPPDFPKGVQPFTWFGANSIYYCIDAVKLGEGKVVVNESLPAMDASRDPARHSKHVLYVSVVN